MLGADAQLPDAEGCTAELVARRSGQILCQEILQVVTSAEQKDLELLERPKRPRKARLGLNLRGETAWKRRKGSDEGGVGRRA